MKVKAMVFNKDERESLEEEVEDSKEDGGEGAEEREHGFEQD